jgi:hypothetical protein
MSNKYVLPSIQLAHRIRNTHSLSYVTALNQVPTHPIASCLLLKGKSLQKVKEVLTVDNHSETRLMLQLEILAIEKQHFEQRFSLVIGCCYVVNESE